METSTIDLLGYAAGAMTTASFLPQAVKALRTRRTRDISLAMYVIFTMGISSWLAYGLLIGSWPVVLANLFTLILALAILGMKLCFEGAGSGACRPERRSDAP
jgi:MtN3 and saliva related transmembrane protein